MNAWEFARLCAGLPDGGTLELTGREVIEVWSDDCPVVEGYRFSNTASAEENPTGRRLVLIYMKGKKGVVLDGRGAKILIHGVMTPFLFDDCEDLTFRNFTIDHARPTMNEFTVLSNNGKGTCTLRVARDTRYEVRAGRLVWIGETGKNGAPLWEHDLRDPMSIAFYLDPATEELYAMPRGEGMRFPCVPDLTVERDDGQGLLEVRLSDPAAFLPAGCVIQTRNTVRDQVGGAFVCCRNVRCERLSVRAMHGLGIVAQFCENIVFSGMDINPGEGRTSASNADFF